MKKLLFIIAFAISLNLNAQTNFIGNGNFEQGTTEGLNSKIWEGTMNTGIDDSEPISGTKSLVVTILSSTGNHLITDDFWKLNINWRLPIFKGAKYKVSFKAVASEPCAVIGAFSQNFGPFDVLSQNTFQISSTPQSYEYTTNNIPNVIGSGSFMFFLGHIEAGTQIWFDDISITEVTSPLTDGNICNGDFETDVVNEKYYDKPLIYGWSKHMDGATVNYEIDQTAPISGTKSIKITGVGTPATNGWKAQLIWVYSPIPEKKYMLEFKAKSSTDFIMPVESFDSWTNGRNNDLFYKEFNVTPELKTFKLDVPTATSTQNDSYFLAFWFGLIPNGASVWLDDIKFYQYDNNQSTGQEIKEKDNIVVRSNQGNIIIESPINGEVNIYTASGQKLKKSKLVCGINKINIGNGLFIVQVVEANIIVKSTKVVIH